MIDDSGIDGSLVARYDRSPLSTRRRRTLLRVRSASLRQELGNAIRGMPPVEAGAKLTTNRGILVLEL